MRIGIPSRLAAESLLYYSLGDNVIKCSNNHLLMKNLFLWLLFLAFLVSCNNISREAALSEQDLIVDENSLAIGITSDYILSNYHRLIDESSDSDFVDDNTLSAMKRSRIYQKRAMPQTKAKTKADTLIYSEEIPFHAHISEKTLIYEDGRSEYVQITELDPRMNPLLGFHETELDLSHCVAKLVVKDGEAISYNTNGEVLSRQDAPRPDYSEYLKEIKDGKKKLELETTRQGTKSAVSRDINWLRAKMESENPTKSGENPPYKIYEIEGGRVVLEQYMGLTKGGEDITVKTFLSSDIMKNYGYEQLEGGVLKVRCTNSFDESSLKTKGGASSHSELSEELPSRTVIEMLSYLSDGTPMISVSDKEYKDNSVKFYFK